MSYYEDWLENDEIPTFEELFDLYIKDRKCLESVVNDLTNLPNIILKDWAQKNHIAYGNKIQFKNSLLVKLANNYGYKKLSGAI